MKKYQFKNINRKRLLVCPTCLELLKPYDIESFFFCPYCNCKIEITQDIEDFLMQPVIEHWIMRETQQSLLDTANILRIVAN